MMAAVSMAALTYLGMAGRRQALSQLIWRRDARRELRSIEAFALQGDGERRLREGRLVPPSTQAAL
jgi:hypothetical protein